MSRQKCCLFNVKTNNYLCSCRGAHKKVGTIDLQVIHDANVITAFLKANVCLVQGNRKTEVRFQRASHVASGNPSPNKIVGDTYDWHIKRSFVLRCTLNHFNTILTLRSTTGAKSGKTRSTRMISKYV